VSALKRRLSQSRRFRSATRRIHPGADRELDELRELSRNSKQFLAQMEQRERQRTGIASLKVRFNSVFGYYLEISKANQHLAPPTTNAARPWSMPNASPHPNSRNTKPKF